MSAIALQKTCYSALPRLKMVHMRKHPVILRFWKVGKENKPRDWAKRSILLLPCITTEVGRPLSLSSDGKFGLNFSLIMESALSSLECFSASSQGCCPSALTDSRGWPPLGACYTNDTHLRQLKEAERWLSMGLPSHSRFHSNQIKNYNPHYFSAELKIVGLSWPCVSSCLCSAAASAVWMQGSKLPKTQWNMNWH